MQCMCFAKMLVLRYALSNQSRFLSNTTSIANRFTRETLRNRLYKQELKDVHNKIRKNGFQNVNNPQVYSDAISLRPPKDLWKALGFTVLVGTGAFTVAIISDIKRMKEKAREAASDFFKATFKSYYDGQNQTDSFEWKRLSEGDKTAALLIGLNVVVFCLWKIRAFEPQMWRYFTNSFAQRSLCSPMLLSAFSHSNLIHLALNMYVVYSFTNVAIDKFFGPDQFWAFYASAAVASSFTSLIHKAIVKSPVRALGASGAILGLLGYVCMKIPDARLKIVFIPNFDFSAQSAIYGVLLFDILGLVFRFRLFDHAAHLGGTLFGMFYAMYGEHLIWEQYGGLVERWYSGLTKS
ncbi:unnamed protein product [Auanema sp. JU1783]|nr:unnamed protein product [Auanema sp. JU1783]